MTDAAARDARSRDPLEKVISVCAANYSLAGGASGTQTLYFFAHNPSPRLRFSISAGFEIATNAPFVAGSAAPTWQMTAIRLSQMGGPTADLDSIFVNSSSGVATPRALPDGYEVDSAVKDLRGALVLHSGTGFDFNTGLEGSLVLEGRWEPHDGVWSEDLRAIIAQADLRMQGNPLTINCGS